MHMERESDRHERVLGVTAAVQCGVREKNSQLAGGKDSHSTVLQLFPTCALQEEAKRQWECRKLSATWTSIAG